MTKVSAGAPGQNSHRKKGAENIVQLIADGIKDDAQSSDKTIPCDVISIESLNQNSSTDSLLSLAQLFDKADDAEYGAIRANQEEILRCRGPSQNHVSNSSEEKLPDENMNTVSKDTPSVKSQVSVLSTSSSGQISKSNKSRLPISILPEDSEEKRKHIIGSTPCPMCNKDHEGENIKGEWGSGMYFGEEAYYLKCRKAFNSGIPIVSVKA
ncbi:unnamed protein product [Rhizophagus irregularis]|nr:unnamed protein product [Rhizophagus irregularis]